jgi:hypothetical protein
LISPSNKDRKTAMPRGSKPGERRGGRQRGTPNKKTALRSAALAAAAANPDMTPLDFLLGIMRDPNVSSELRIRVAQAAAPFIHAKAGTAGSSDPAASAKPIDGVCDFTIDPVLARALRDDHTRASELLRKKMAPNEYGGPPTAAEEQEQAWLGARITKTAKAIGCPAGYGLKQAKKDDARLHRLYCQRISPPQCGGGALPEAEDAEEAQLRARVTAFYESPEGCARGRISHLEMQDFRGGRSAAEQNELDHLRTLYPKLAPDDPNREALEALRRVDAKGKPAVSKLDRSKPGLSAVPRPFSDDDRP